MEAFMGKMQFSNEKKYSSNCTQVLKGPPNFFNSHSCSSSIHRLSGGVGGETFSLFPPSLPILTLKSSLSLSLTFLFLSALSVTRIGFLGLGEGVASAAESEGPC